ncbi:MAG: phosphoenolpyruvate--protein phosphotransferase [Gammaproteobacteria bacterium]|nr:phosphoenolpyruvate--protein phosphotransferase [Gammaproteobacteria bacterium]
MLTLHGAGVGSGIAIGEAFVVHRDRPDTPQYLLAPDRIEAEVQRFRAAIGKARDQLIEIRRSIPLAAPSEIATFMDAHILMLQDPVLAEEPVATIREKHCNAEWALAIHRDALVEVFEAMEDPYLRSKKDDIDQVVNRVYEELLDLHEQGNDFLDKDLNGKIVVTNDLAPADTVLLKHHKMVAFVTNLGGPISHTAILARSLRIPAIVGLHGATRYIRHREQLIVDGKSGILIVAPDEPVLEEYRERQRGNARLRRKLEALTDVPSRTRDGKSVTLMANVELPEDIEAADQVGANGVGLYRTEYLFMNRAEPPSEDEQYEAYARALDRLQRPVTIRTLDLGADKQVDGGRSGGNVSTNPALGRRAVRLCLSDPGLFRPQLRAILRASAHGPAEIMIPMVSSLDELDQVLGLVQETKRELERENQSFDAAIPIGGMIEVPAAAIAADLFAAKLDFLSIGTNDLIQYTLAIDRVDDEVNYLYDPLHPSVLRLIAMIIDAGRRAGVPVSMCGEMAGDAEYTRLLLGLGLRIFSMDPTTLLEVKERVRASVLSDLEKQAKEILMATDTGRLRELVDRMNEH